MRLKDKVIVITGAGAGIGRAAAVKSAREGARLSLVDIDEAGLKETLALVKKSSPETEAVTVKADVVLEEEVRRYVMQTVQRFGGIDGFFNNAGIEGEMAPTADYDLPRFQEVIEVNLRGAFLGLKHVLGAMKTQGRGSIVNTSSIGGIVALEGSNAYVASKHGIIGLTKNAAVEYGRMGIRTNAICPGPIRTALNRRVAARITGGDIEKYYADISAAIPAGRPGEPEEVADLVAYLLSDEASYINGAVIAIDGGLTAK